MIYLNPHQLAVALRDDRLSERTKYRLVLLGSGFQLVVGGLLPAGPDSWRVQSVLFLFPIMVWGIRSCYIANSRGDGRAFVERFICLSVPVFIYGLLVYYMAAFTAVRLGVPSGAFSSDLDGAWGWFLLYVGMTAALYRVLRHYLTIAAGALRHADGSAA